MYLFTRRVVVSPTHLRAGMAHAIAMTEFVNQKTDLEISLHQVLQGEPLGTLMFAYRTESFAASLESADGLVHSDEYLTKIEEGAQHFVGNAEDRLGKFQHIAGEVSGPPAAAAVVSAAIDVPQVAKAMSWSLELTEYTANLTGVPVALLTSNYGQYGTVSFVSYGQSIAQLEQSQEKTNSDPGFLQRLADSEGLFIAGSGAGVLSRKIA
ncbi:MAG: hypothetical protein JRG96_10215 [Deltaproteobacteria bacterium]|nr:hypothetical protein [Deltaproteobacteria bacterium]MBW2416900.1 hypothetical protein [Deltaproteobacteria bacterium]